MQPHHSLRLPDGRMLAFNDYGDPDGSPVLFFHGAPSARIEPELFKVPDLAQSLGIRLIAPDRPGLGRSDFQANRSVADWPADVLALVDHLGLERFSLLGYSGGGPYALACAAVFPERIESVTLVSSTGPHEIEGMTVGINPNSLQFMQMCVNRPRLGQLMSRMMAFVARRFPGRMAAQAASSLPEPDAEYVSVPENGMMFARLVAEAARSGGRGPQHDMALMVLPWGVDFDAISTRVALWHGEQDRNAPVVMGRWLAGRLPDASLHVFPDDGHLSVFANHAEAILRSMR